MRPLWLSGLAALLLFLGIAWTLAPLQPGILVLQFAFTPASFAAVIHNWPAAHLALFRAHFAADYALLVCYGAFGYLCSTRTTVFASLTVPWQSAARWALPLAAAFDATEIALQLWLTEAPRFGHQVLYFATASCALAKWLLLIAFGALALISSARSKP